MQKKNDANLVVCSVDQNFIHDLEETGDICNVAIDHALRLSVVHPHRLSYRLNTADI